MRYCRHADGRCLDGDTPCSECDAEGYPIGARRRLKRTSDDMVKDIDDGQCFRVKGVKGEMERLVPVYNGRVKWNTEQGFTVIQTLLSCLGTEGEYVLWDEVNDAEMDVIAWIKNGYGRKSNVPIRHSVCREVVTSTCINNLYHKGSGVGCSCNCNQARHWRNRRSEVVEMGKERNFEVVTSDEDWIRKCNGVKYCPFLRCTTCKQTVTTTSINNLRQGGGVGCTCNSTQSKHWRNRRSEVVEMGTARGFEVVTTESEWIQLCNGATYYPLLRCTTCNETVTSTCIDRLQQGKGVGCTCNRTYAKHWRYRRSEVLAWGKERNFTVLTTEDEWIEQCNGKDYCPSLCCTACNQAVTSTSISSLQRGRFGCNGCRNKTEGLLLKWLQMRLPSVTVSTQHCGPRTTCGGQTHFDFHLAFPDGFGVFLELDGAQHFWTTQTYYTDSGAARDLQKETWALQQGLCVIRVLQEDVWNDRLDWQGWILRSIEAARECGDARVFTPDAPEYRSNESAYVQERT